MFRNIDDATDRLIEELSDLDQSWLLVPISENGNRIADRISDILGIKSQRLFIQPIFCQKNIDCEIGMINEFEDLSFDEVLKKHFEVENEILEKSIQIIYNHKLLPEIKKCREKLFDIPRNISKVLIIDETIETGLRMEMAIETLNRFQLDNISIATPIIPEQMFFFFENSVKNIFYVDKVPFYTDVVDYYIEER